MRGKHCKDSFVSVGIGITPACAGKTKEAKSSTVSARDHPRVCGENALSLLRVELFTGSPPRVRGKPYGVNQESKNIRITPACAGKTVWRESGKQEH